MITQNEFLLQAALEYAGLGYSVFPCGSGDKKPITPKGCLDATTDEDQIIEWWEKNTFANIGISTKGLLIVDIDGSDNEWLTNPKIRESLSQGVMSQTPSGGRHFIFRQPPDANLKNTTGKLALKVDTRADGGYIVAPPSQINSEAYQWLSECGLDEPLESLAEAPEWIVEKLKEVAQERFELPPDGNKLPKGTQHTSLFKAGCKMRDFGCTYEVINAALQTMNQKQCTEPGTVQEIEKIARSAAKYKPDQLKQADTECWYEQMFDQTENEEPESTDPGPLDESLLRIPGFISEVMDYTLETAPYPNQVLAFCGALVLQAFLAGRKVSDQFDNRTNLYLLGLANSGAGKDRPRKVNVEILSKIGLIHCLGEKFASGEGLEDTLFQSPNMIFQTDEFDGILQSISHSKDARFEGIMSTMLTLFSSANSVFSIRKKAGLEQAAQIDQPCLTVFGTAIPQHYYAALSGRMLTNGLFSRMIILGSGKRGEGQDSKKIALPVRILDTAERWKSFSPSSGNLSGEHPTVATVEYSTDARAAIRDARMQADLEYDKAELKVDSIGMTVWSRAYEHICKMSLIYAISENHRSPHIGENAVSWAVRLIFHLTQKMLFNAHHNTFENPFQELCNKAVRWIRESENETVPHFALLKHLRTSANDLGEIVRTLEESGKIKIIRKATKGRPSVVYTTNLSPLGL
ncbi:bifunctional DNA primase/polymerase [Gimesia fumaroli]|nr:bifunctional DNA primase/polymerase [Gimesia fumaroli]